MCFSENYSDIYLLKASTDSSYVILMVQLSYILRREFLLGDQHISLIMIFFSVCGLVTNALLVKINKIWKYSDSRKQKPLLGAMVIVIGFIGLSMFDEVLFFLISLTFMTIAKIFLDSTITEALLLRTVKGTKGLVLTTSENLYLFFDIICPIISSSLIETVGYKMSYLFCSFILFSGSTAFYCHQIRSESKN